MSLTVAKRNGNLLPDFIEDFFGRDNFLSAMPSLSKGLSDGFFERVPEANIIENPGNYQIELAAPGLKRGDFKVNMQDGILTISAEKESKSEEEGKNFKRQEFSFNSFSRSFYLPENLKDEKIDAKYEDGVLKVTLPKKEVSKNKPSKQIKVG